ncbi:MAG: class I SAM-dependent methyltransferase [Candidatus Heimdallarchaeota archaeon]|nr:class I SAM-dependent methyltransferase [Candidatus Heimdallarchaeota archaeon]
MKSELIDDNHFSQVATIYLDLRTTDYQPISYIISQLKSRENLKLIDLGCGAGRYDNLLLNEIDKSCVLTGLDANQAMLEQFICNLKENNHYNFHAVYCEIEHVDNLHYGLFDVVLSFNALHHFNISKTLSIIKKLLKKNGTAFLYTRTSNQNERSIWGKHFPNFNLYESRLYSLSKLENIIYQVDGLELDNIIFFTYNRSESFDQLIYKAESHHYSTFSFYDHEEFIEMSTRFKLELRQQFIDLENITWKDRNIMLKIIKT